MVKAIGSWRGYGCAGMGAFLLLTRGARGQRDLLAPHVSKNLGAPSQAPLGPVSEPRVSFRDGASAPAVVPGVGLHHGVASAGDGKPCGMVG